jgi:uncharacterized membrane protein
MKLAGVIRSRRGASLVVVIVILYWVALVLQRQFHDQAGEIMSGATFAAAMAAFYGFMMLSRAARDETGVFQDGDVRLAVACAFVTMYLELLALIIFSPEFQLSEIGKVLTENLLTQTALIVGFYFATTGALEYAKLRGNRSPETKATDQ